MADRDILAEQMDGYNEKEDCQEVVIGEVIDQVCQIDESMNVAEETESQATEEDHGSQSNDNDEGSKDKSADHELKENGIDECPQEEAVRKSRDDGDENTSQASSVDREPQNNGIDDKYDADVPPKDYVVEKILDKKIDTKGRSKYLVKWEGYPSSSNTWEPLENLVDCDSALEKYEVRRVGIVSNRVANMQDKGVKQTKTSQLKQVGEIHGLTIINNENYFLVSLEGEQRHFIRASLANKLFPGKVIDFYVKNIRWRQKSD